VAGASSTNEVRVGERTLLLAVEEDRRLDGTAPFTPHGYDLTRSPSDHARRLSRVPGCTLRAPEAAGR